jgi:hypothetical protein
MAPEELDAAKYGYEDPDAVNKYGYEDPDAIASASAIAIASSTNKSGYEDPDANVNKYGYEDPDAGQNKVSHGEAGGFLRTGTGTGSRQARRSSMKQEGAPRTRRRASIQTVGMIEVRLPGRSDPVLRRTSIDFMEASPGEVPSTVEDPKEIPERWMSTDDYKKIEHDNHKIVRAIEKGTDKHFCTRGLENQLEKEGDRIKEDAHQAVWEEQLRQKKEGTFDEAKLMEKYRMATIQSKIGAVERAEQDNAEIEAYLKSTRKMMRRMSC